MGFGTLFLGTFLLINISFYDYTDLVAALIMLVALSNLSRYNRPMKAAMLATSLFAVYALPAFLLAVLELFPPAPSTFVSLMRALVPIRYVLIGAVSVTVLLGIRALADEVGLVKLKTRVDCILVLPIFSAVLCALMSIEPLVGAIGQGAGAFTLIALLLSLISTVLLISTVYTAYARICLPEDADMPERPSRFALINRYRQRKAERAAEEAKIRAALLKEKRDKQKGNKKK